MAKKKTASPKATTRGKKLTTKGTLNLSAEIRKTIQSHPDWSARQVIEQIQKDNRTSKIKASTAGVTWSNERKKLGLSKKRGNTKLRARRIPESQVANSHVSSAVEIIKAAKTLIAQCGSTTAAKQLLDQF